MIPHRGDVVLVSWLDIMEEVNGDPGKARLARRDSVGFFWEERSDEGLPILVTTTTMDEPSSEQQGWCAYPLACIVTIKILRRARLERQ